MWMKFGSYRSQLFLIAMITAGCLGAAAETTVVNGQVVVQHSKSSTSAKGNSDVVVWLEPLDPGALPVKLSLPRDAAMMQKDKQFHPHVLAVPVGTSVVFPNADPFFHNVFSLYKGERFDLGLYEAGSSRTVKFDRPGVSFIFCNIHPEMSAYVLALTTPYYAVSDSRGQITIANVPPGAYRVHVWYERAETNQLARLAREIEVTGAEFRLPEIDVRESDRFTPEHLNKHGKPYEVDRSPY